MLLAQLRMQADGDAGTKQRICDASCSPLNAQHMYKRRPWPAVLPKRIHRMRKSYAAVIQRPKPNMLTNLPAYAGHESAPRTQVPSAPRVSSAGLTAALIATCKSPAACC